MDVSENSATPQIIHFNRVFHYKPSIVGYPYLFSKHPYGKCRYVREIDSKNGLSFVSYDQAYPDIRRVFKRVGHPGLVLMCETY